MISTEPQTFLKNSITRNPAEIPIVPEARLKKNFVLIKKKEKGTLY